MVELISSDPEEIPFERKEKDVCDQKFTQKIVLADRGFWIEIAIDIIKHQDSTGKVKDRFG